jgi:hypothetical protein
MVQVNQSDKTRAWCRKNEFTGIRSDPILNNVEIWMLGSIAKEVTELELQLDPNAVAKAYAEVFQLDVNNVELE